MKKIFLFFIFIAPMLFLSCLGGDGDDTDVSFGIPNPPLPNCEYCIPQGALFTCEEIKDALNRIKQIRAEVGLPPLEWDCQLAEAAQRWAEYLAEHGLFEHEPNSPYGENLYMVYGSIPTLVEAIEDWYEEKKNFKLGADWCKNFQEVGHYTQLVWKDTTKIGCGMAKYKGKNAYVIVCKFYPPGNICNELPF